MKFEVEVLQMLPLNGVKIQTGANQCVFDCCGRECHAKSVLIFLSLGNPDLRGYLKGAQSGILFIS